MSSNQQLIAYELGINKIEPECWTAKNKADFCEQIKTCARFNGGPWYSYTKFNNIEQAIRHFDVEDEIDIPEEILEFLKKGETCIEINADIGNSCAFTPEQWEYNLIKDISGVFHSNMCESEFEIAKDINAIGKQCHVIFTIDKAIKFLAGDTSVFLYYGDDNNKTDIELAMIYVSSTLIKMDLKPHQKYLLNLIEKDKEKKSQM